MKKSKGISALLRASLIATGASLALGAGSAGAGSPVTPIQHVVVIFQENVSFDHYFATYPNATNPSGEPRFTAAANTPSVNGLTSALLNRNPNALNPANAGLPMGAAPFRLDPSQAATCDQDHDYQAEQQAFDFGLMDAFPAFTGSGDCGGFDYGHGTGLVMGYFDGNTTTALWNYAQKFAMSDNFYGTDFGPSAVGAINLISGQTGGVIRVANNPDDTEVNGTTVVGDPQPLGDVCDNRDQARLGGKNVGDLLNAAGLTWGWFEGGFDLTVVNSDGSTGCSRDNPNPNGGTKADYIPHHAAFQFYLSTANLMHKRPTSTAMIGQTDIANHEYDTHDFFDALAIGNMPAVSYIKAPGYEDGHAGYSSPLLEQQFIVKTINTIMQSPFWPTTAIFITWDDSDGWYDHQMGPIVNSSAINLDQITAPGKCGNGTPLGGIQGRCGYGPRIPFFVISPFAKANFVDHTVTDQTSILSFIENNWKLGKIPGSFDALSGSVKNMFNFGATGARTRILDPNTGEPTT